MSIVSVPRFSVSSLEAGNGPRSSSHISRSFLLEDRDYEDYKRAGTRGNLAALFRWIGIGPNGVTDGCALTKTLIFTFVLSWIFVVLYIIISDDRTPPHQLASTVLNSRTSSILVKSSNQSKNILPPSIVNLYLNHRTFATSTPPSLPKDNSTFKSALFALGTGVGAAVTYYILFEPPAPPTKPVSALEDAMSRVPVGLTPQQIDVRLRAAETRVKVDKADARGTMVAGFELSVVNSNDPIEDYHDQRKTPNGMIFAQVSVLPAVYDGHSGTECAEVLSHYLSSYVAAAIKAIPRSSNNNRQQAISDAISSAFIAMDNDIARGAISLDPNYKGAFPYSRDKVHAALRPAMAGSCALLTYIEGTDVYVACTGDSRAVLGQLRADGTYQALPLSADQTASNPSEHARMLEEHPGERDTVLVNGRVLGYLMPTRAFGDCRYKWPAKVAEAVIPPIFGRSVARNYYTPPYVTARPEIIHHTIEPGRDRFLIMATDGVWDELSSDEGADLVGRHLSKIGASPPATAAADEGIVVEERNYAYKDRNSATHLIRNALGGADEVQMGKLLAIPPPYSRRFRDDMTAIVVHFHDGVFTTGGNGGSGNGSGGGGKPIRDIDLSLTGPKKPRIDQLAEWSAANLPPGIAGKKSKASKEGVAARL
ncbi:hypothetical protein SmJEL517_g01289 [Synchytrium microbalum]|uniref:PPM-type phosphatase domain-containing protein n=1 Tax=Synchytrium microbalum TaxID=1806994 RepID=A0A507C4Z5_9FUNG|nr:uncharacterized protein SmJEL517_g01289 [Synchytrium microbalum]TPX36620.1 hypothetical protein SmJEL517_g01289 [Synchytrium microbalum]